MRCSICFGVYHRAAQVGFARVVTDRARSPYLAEVFTLEAHRGTGLSKRLMRCVADHAELQGLRRALLGTRDAPGLNRQFGFRSLARQTRLKGIPRTDLYRAS